jgi:hypothetical protein
MEQEKPPLCSKCGLAMTLTTRISHPPAQFIYRCEPCKAETWLPDRSTFR